MKERELLQKIIIYLSVVQTGDKNAMLLTYLNSRISRIGSNTTSILLVPRHLPVPLQPPLRSPTVLDEVIILATFTPKPNSKYCVVHTTVGTPVVPEHSTLVATESQTTRIDSNSNGTNRCDSFMLR